MNDRLRTRIRQQQETDLLEAENRAMSQAIVSSSICESCNGPIISPARVSGLNELRLENALLLSTVETLSTFVARLNFFRSLCPAAAASSAWLFAVVVMTVHSLEEVESLARHGAWMWTSNEKLDLREYYSHFFPWFARNAPGFVHEVSTASGLVHVDASVLVSTLMDHARWPKIFPSIVADVSTEYLAPRLQVINVEFMPLTPLIPTRNVKLVRCSKRIANNEWVIADFSLYFCSYEDQLRPNFMRFPSGYLVKRRTDGFSEVTIIDHWVYKEEAVRNRFNPDTAFGAQRWLSALQRHYYSTCFYSGSAISPYVVDPICLTSLFNLATRMVYLFCTGVFGISRQRWKFLFTAGSQARVYTQASRDVNGPCVVINSTGLSRMRAKPEAIYNLIKDETRNSIWRHLTPSGARQVVIRCSRSFSPGDEVRLYSIECPGPQKCFMLQETYFEASSAMIINACFQAPSLAAVLAGDTSRAQLLPCGITIMPDRELQGSLVSVGCHYFADQPMVTSSDEVVKNLKRMVNGTLIRVQNAQIALPVSSSLRTLP